MSQLSTPPAPAPADQAPPPAAVFRVLNDGTVLYASLQKAQECGRQGSAGAPAPAATRLSLAAYGDRFPDADGQTVPGTLEGLLEFQATGFLLVMAAMLALWLLSKALSRLAVSFAGGAVAGVETAHPGPSPSQAAPKGGLHPGLTDQQLIVILTAAASEVLGSSVRIEKIRPVNAGDTNWTAEGRMVLHSHRLK